MLLAMTEGCGKIELAPFCELKSNRVEELTPRPCLLACAARPSVDLSQPGLHYPYTHPQAQWRALSVVIPMVYVFDIRR
jgi:hypothetical protein